MYPIYVILYPISVIMYLFDNLAISVQPKCADPSPNFARLPSHSQRFFRISPAANFHEKVFDITNKV